MLGAMPSEVAELGVSQSSMQLFLVLGDSLPGLGGTVWTIRLGYKSQLSTVTSSPDTSLTGDVKSLYSHTIRCVFWRTVGPQQVVTGVTVMGSKGALWWPLGQFRELGLGGQGRGGEGEPLGT